MLPETSRANPFKRKLDLPDNSTKRFKQVEEISPFNQIPFEIIEQVLAFLKYSELLHFEMTSKKWQNAPSSVWKARKIEDRYDCEWKMARGELNPDKWDYILSCALYKYIMIDKFPSVNAPNLATAQQIYQKFGGLIQRFPMLMDYIGQDLKRFAGIEMGCSDLTAKLNFNSAVLEDYPGELVLNGLILSKNESSDGILTKECFSNAIKKKAFFACQLFFQIRSACNFERTKKWYFDLAIEAAIQNETKALTQVINIFGPNELVKFAHKKFIQNEWKGADVLFNHFFTLDKNPSFDILSKAALVKLRLKKWADCDRLYTHLLTEYHPYVEPSLLSFAAFAKLELHQWEQADLLYTQILSAYKEELPPAAILNNAARAKLKQKLWDKADNLYAQALTAYGGNPSRSCLSGAAYTKFMLKQYKEADLLYDRVLLIYGQNPPLKLVSNSQSAKRKAAKAV